MNLTSIFINNRIKISIFVATFVLFTGAAFGDMKADIYSRLDCCPCEVPFKKCACKEAKEMKVYIGALLDAGLPKEEIFYKVAKKFSLNTIIDEKIRKDIEKRVISEAGQKRAQIILEPTSFNFGEVNKAKGRIKKIFKLHNKGNEDLIVTNIRVSCSCVTASLKIGRNKSPYFGIAGAGSGWQAKIEPGGFGELEVMLDLAHESMVIGRQIRDVFISSNDPAYPEVTLRVEVGVGE